MLRPHQTRSGSSHFVAIARKAFQT